MTKPSEFVVIGRTSGCWEVWRRWPGVEEFTQLVATCSSSPTALGVRRALQEQQPA